MVCKKQILKKKKRKKFNFFRSSSFHFASFDNKGIEESVWNLNSSIQRSRKRRRIIKKIFSNFERIPLFLLIFFCNKNKRDCAWKSSQSRCIFGAETRNTEDLEAGFYWSKEGVGEGGRWVDSKRQKKGGRNEKEVGPLASFISI